MDRLAVGWGWVPVGVPPMLPSGPPEEADTADDHDVNLLVPSTSEASVAAAVSRVAPFVTFAAVAGLLFGYDMCIIGGGWGGPAGACTLWNTALWMLLQRRWAPSSASSPCPRQRRRRWCRA